MKHDELSISRIILYVKDIKMVSEFYRKYFGFIPIDGLENGWLELSPSNGTGCYIALHKASKAQKSGSEIKISFYVSDVDGFIEKHKGGELKFGTVHEFNGIKLSNGKDPAGNSIQISSRINIKVAQQGDAPETGSSE